MKYPFPKGNRQRLEKNQGLPAGRKALHKMEKKLRVLAVCVLFPVIASYTVYFGFSTSYTKGVFHEEGFRDQYESGIYKYRVLGSAVLLAVADYFENNDTAVYILKKACGAVPEANSLMDENHSVAFYLSYFLVNTVFLVITSLLLYKIFEKDSSASLLTLFLSSVICLFQFVVCPYDNMSYAFMAGALLLIVRPVKNNLLWLSVMLLAATLTRESSALILSFYLAYHHREVFSRDKKAIIELAVLILVFILTYAGLRLVYGFDHAVVQDIRLVSNLTWPRALIGIIALLTVSFIAVSEAANKKDALVFLAAALPYILFTLAAAYLWELRLWIPVWIGLFSLRRSHQSEETESCCKPEEPCLSGK